MATAAILKFKFVDVVSEEWVDTIEGTVNDADCKLKELYEKNPKRRFTYKVVYDPRFKKDYDRWVNYI